MVTKRCESEVKRTGGPPGIAHGSLLLASRARPAGELAGAPDRFAPATPSLPFGGGLRSAGNG